MSCTITEYSMMKVMRVRLMMTAMIMTIAMTVYGMSAQLLIMLMFMMHTRNKSSNREN